MQAIRNHVQSQIIQWIAPGTANVVYNISNNGTRVLKHGASLWGSYPPLISAYPLTAAVTYIQMKVHYLNDRPEDGGLIFGISRGTDIGCDDDNAKTKTVCIKYRRKNYSHVGVNDTLTVFSSDYILSGDVLAIVVDMKRDVVLFYRNTKLVAKSKNKPSMYQPTYVVLWLFYQKSDIEMGDFYPYHSLERPTQ